MSSVSASLVCLLWLLPAGGTPFEKDIAIAVKTVQMQEQRIKTIAAAYPVSQREVVSIVFPEVMRYNYFKDFLEMQGLEWGYVSKGSAFVDFSIGLFQMKPSFVEALEAYILAHPQALGAFQSLAHYATADVQTQRAERLQRLKDWDNQVRYACAFWAVCSHKFRHIPFKNRAEAVQFYASAYNFGFMHTEAAIGAWRYQKAFPYGKDEGDGQMAYGDLAVRFYEQNSHFLAP